MKIKEKLLVVANWKANPDSLRLAKSLVSGIKKNSLKSKGVETVVCPPIIYLESLRPVIRPLSLGAQDLFSEPNGPFTGSVGYLSLMETKVRFVIVGHSERRAMGETDIDVNKKVITALSIGASPIICVGEKSRTDDMSYLGILKTQITEAFKGVPKSKVKDVVIAYEPIWAIGKNADRGATPSEINEVSIFIKRVIGDMYKTSSVPPVRIIYGGSVNPSNVESLIRESRVNGFLVGRASLTPKAFNEIVTAVNLSKHD